MNEAPSSTSRTNQDLVSKKVFDMGLAAPSRIPLPHHEVERWNRYWRDFYGVTESFEHVLMPALPDFPVRVIAMHWRFSSRCNAIAAVYRKHCQNLWWQYANDLDKVVVSHTRGGTYAILVPDTREAGFGWDETEKRNLSCRDVWARNLLTVTLPERLVLGDKDLLERKEHLDQKVVTTCAGSRRADGDVPDVYLNDDGEVYVNYVNPEYAGDFVRFRLAIA